MTRVLKSYCSKTRVFENSGRVIIDLLKVIVTKIIILLHSVSGDCRFLDRVRDSRENGFKMTTFFKRKIIHLQVEDVYLLSGPLFYLGY